MDSAPTEEGGRHHSSMRLVLLHKLEEEGSLGVEEHILVEVVVGTVEDKLEAATRM